MVPLSPLSYNTLQRSHQNEKKKKKKKRKKKKKEEEEEEEEEDGKKEVLFTYSEFKDVSFPISVGMGPLSLIWFRSLQQKKTTSKLPQKTNQRWQEAKFTHR